VMGSGPGDGRAHGTDQRGRVRVCHGGTLKRCQRCVAWWGVTPTVLKIPRSAARAVSPHPHARRRLNIIAVNTRDPPPGIA
jgi:hypothetical protein